MERGAVLAVEYSPGVVLSQTPSVAPENTFSANFWSLNLNLEKPLGQDPELPDQASDKAVL